MPKKGKIYQFKSYHMSLLVYRAETWSWTKADINKLMAAEMRFLRSIKGKKPKEIE
jgi:hypothetical protein